MQSLVRGAELVVVEVVEFAAGAAVVVKSGATGSIAVVDLLSKFTPELQGNWDNQRLTCGMIVCVCVANAEVS